MNNSNDDMVNIEDQDIKIPSGNDTEGGQNKILTLNPIHPDSMAENSSGIDTSQQIHSSSPLIVP